MFTDTAFHWPGEIKTSMNPEASSTNSGKRLRIAVVGSGIAGLTSAFLFSQKHHVVMFEKEKGIGMDAQSVDSCCCGKCTSGETCVRLDTPPRVFSETYYPNLVSLYRMVGIPFERADCNFACSLNSAGQNAPLFRYHKFGGFIIPYFWDMLAVGGKYARLIFDGARFFLRGPVHLAGGKLDGLTLGQYLDRYKYSDEFVDSMLLPMLTVVCTCSIEGVRSYPAAILVDYLASKHGLFTSRWHRSAHLRVSVGVKEAAERLVARVQRLQVGTSVDSVTKGDPTLGTGPVVGYTDEKGEAHQEEFDHVIVATQALHASRVVRGGGRRLAWALSRFEYETSRVIVHTDKELMPADRSQWAPINLLIESSDADSNCNCNSSNSNCSNSNSSNSNCSNSSSNSNSNSNSSNRTLDSPTTVPSPASSDPASDADAAPAAAADAAPAPAAAAAAAAAAERAAVPQASIWMNALDVRLKTDVFQTLGAFHRPRPSLIQHEALFWRPVMSYRSVLGTQLLAPEQGKGGVWFCGAYSLPSMPLLENGVDSALAVGVALGAVADPAAWVWKEWMPRYLLEGEVATAAVAAAGGDSGEEGGEDETGGGGSTPIQLVGTYGAGSSPNYRMGWGMWFYDKMTGLVWD